MSVIVKGMKMPRCCEECPAECVEENYYGDVMSTECPFVYKGYTEKIRQAGRLEDCPLIEVPPHGDLIDAEALNKTLIEMSEIEWNKGVSCSWADAFKEVTDVVNFEPIIIEADMDVMYYPQVDGITPTVIKKESQENR